MNMYRVGDAGERIPYNVVPVEFQKAKRETVIDVPSFDAPPPPVKRTERSVEMLGVVLVIAFAALWFVCGFVVRGWVG